MLRKLRIPFFAKKLPKEVEQEVLDREDLRGESIDEGDYIYKTYSRSLLVTPPGEILRLNYSYIDEDTGVFKTSNKTILITATERGPKGNFISTRENRLLCCFELNPESFTFKLVLKLFYKKENRCNYKLVPSFLKFIFGLSAFKTLNVQNINSVYIMLKKKEVN